MIFAKWFAIMVVHMMKSVNTVTNAILVIYCIFTSTWHIYPSKVGTPAKDCEVCVTTCKNGKQDANCKCTCDEGWTGYAYFLFVGNLSQL